MATTEIRAALKELCDALEQEHQTIRATVEELRKPRALPRDALPLLRELHTTLAQHFAHEEYPGGFYETLGACVTTHAEDLRVLVDHHFLILSAAQSLKERARTGDVPAEAFDRDLKSLVDSIARHERREHELIAELTR